MLSHSDLEQLSETLESLGFYRFMPSCEVEGAKRRFIQTGDLFLECTGRVYWVDAETLVESGVRGFIMQITPLLQSVGLVRFSVEEEVSPGESYSILLNHVHFNIWSLPADRYNLTNHTVFRLFAAINRMLRQSGTDERIYYKDGGNDTMAIFITDALYNAAVLSGLLRPDELCCP